MTNALRVALVGWGAINRTVADLVADAAVQVVAIARRDWSTGADGPGAGVARITSPAELNAARPELVAEAAGRDSVGPWGFAALEAGADYVVSSVSALADADLLESLRARAVDTGRQVRIQPGALAGVEALSAARSIGIDTVEHRIVKPPAAWRDSPAETLCDLDGLVEPVGFFSATAAQTATAFPKNANVAMTTALAGIGPERTVVSLVADPGAQANRHELTAAGAFGEMAVTIANKPLPANPKTSALAALSLARSITNQVAPIAI